MSFLASHHRAYDSLSIPDIPNHPHPNAPHLPRLHMHALPSYDNPLLPAYPSPNPASLISDPTHPSHLSDRPHIAMPRVGETRCYWSLLTSDLAFLYLDPVLANHLGDQADLLIGKSLLAYVHPDEQASAKLDLEAVLDSLDSRKLHGSVTRVRYSRLSRVRRQLGYTGPSPEWIDANKVAVDANYMAIDIVINYAADGLVLCFMHAVVDLTPRDNDEHNKTCWTNWCGTPNMVPEQIQLLYARLQSTVPQPPTMSRVFQILLNEPTRPLYLSWPPERPGEPTPKDFARLAEDVQITSSGTDAKTTCTRRYKASQVVEFSMGDRREVESIFIPHGAIIFACHKISSYPRAGVLDGNGMPHLGYHYASQSNGDYYASHPPQNPHLPQGPSLHSHTYHPHPQAPMAYSHNTWVNMEPSGSPSQYAHWGVNSLPNGAPISSMRSSSYSTAAPPQPAQQQWSSQNPQAYLETASPISPAVPSAPSPSGLQFGVPGPVEPEDQQPSPSPPSDLVPAPRSGRRNNREQYSNGGRTSGNPPVGVTRCASCKVTHSPEWRKGPSGKKDLCNACGLRFARSRAKKEGANQRRRKDRAMSTLSVKPDVSPSASPVSASYPTMRRGSFFEEGSFLSTSSAGSGSGNDSFSHGPSFDGMTPSPSPPAGGMHYAAGQVMNYGGSAQADSRPHNGGHSGQFYSLPGPAVSTGVPHVSANGHHHLPVRLDPIVPFPNRLSPMVSPASPATNSPLSASMSSASYEREKRHERELDQHLMAQGPGSMGPEQSYRMARSSGYIARDAPF